MKCIFILLILIIHSSKRECIILRLKSYIMMASLYVKELCKIVTTINVTWCMHKVQGNLLNAECHETKKINITFHLARVYVLFF